MTCWISRIKYGDSFTLLNSQLDMSAVDLMANISRWKKMCCVIIPLELFMTNRIVDMAYTT